MTWFTVPSVPQQRVVTIDINPSVCTEVYVPSPVNGRLVGAYAVAKESPLLGTQIDILLDGSVIASIPMNVGDAKIVKKSSAPLPNSLEEGGAVPLQVKPGVGLFADTTTVQLYFISSQ